MELTKGQKIDITSGNAVSGLRLHFGWTPASAEISIDAACFVLADDGRCERDEHMIFYGNSSSPEGAVTHARLSGPDQEAVHVELPKLPVAAARLAFTVTIYEGEQRGYGMKDVANLYVRLIDAATGKELARFAYGADLSQETAVVVGELYRHRGEWKFNAVGSGFYGGLAALCGSFGLETEEEAAPPEAEQPAGATPGASGSSPAADQTGGSAPAVPGKPAVLSINLRKQTVQLMLQKKRIDHVMARVGLVLDISGSMQGLYKNGTVQEVVERILAVACQFDDNALLDVWVYDHEFSRLPPVSENEFAGYVRERILNNPGIHKFGRNNEPPVMLDVIRKYTEEENSPLPVFIVFVNDGGVVRPIKKVITESAVLPIFWQFVGIGDSDFEVLKRLDTMEGRLVDNANFIHIDDMARISDETLYDMLLNEFPQWVREAKQKRIIRS